MARRGSNEGSIYRRKSDGRWVGVLQLGYAGDKRQRRVFYGRTRVEVGRKLALAQRKVDDGLPLPAERVTVAAFLERWLATVEPSLRPNTWRRYAQYVRLHVAPHIGRISLAKLTPDQLQALYADRLTNGLSPMSVRHLHAVLHRALGQAARWGTVARNVADLVDPPRAPHREMAVLTPEQTQALIRVATGERLGAAVTLAVTSGLRQGEILGLRWADVNLDTGTLQVRTSLQWSAGVAVFTQPKTTSSRRQVSLSSVAAGALRAHRKAQTEERLRRGAAWQDLDLVFATEVGGPIDGNNLARRTFARSLRAANVPRIRFHDLRHTAATLLLGQGVHPKIVSEMLGHSRIAVTLDLYSHVTPTMQRHAADAMDAVLQGHG